MPNSHNASASNLRVGSYADGLLLVGFCGFLFFFGLSAFGLIGADEPRYAQVAREMLARHDWITPTLGGHAWLEKPPLYYWQAMLAYRFFGVRDWAARLPSAVDATVLVIAIYFFLRRFRQGFQLDGALITASAAGIIGFARAASTDMPLTVAFAIAMLAWFSWHQTAKRRDLAVFYFFLALGTLAKGPVALFLAFIIVVLFAAAAREWNPIRRTFWLPGILLFCIVALPWYVAVQLRNPEFFRVFILQHNLERFSSNLYRHREPFWYYLPVTLLALVPWTVLVLRSLIKHVNTWLKQRRAQLQSGDLFGIFLAIWLLTPMLFFSFSQSKLPGYILPAVPAGALLVVEQARRQSHENKLDLRIIIFHSIVSAALLIPARTIQYLILQHRLPWNSATAIASFLAIALAVGLVLTLQKQPALRMLRFVTLIPVVLAVGAALRIGAPALDSTLSARPLTEVVAATELQPMPLAVFRVSRELEFGLQFYRDQVPRRYELGPVPASEHLLIAPAGSQLAIAKRIPGRRISYLGTFAPQGLDYFWVSAASR